MQNPYVLKLASLAAVITAVIAALFATPATAGLAIDPIAHTATATLATEHLKPASSAELRRQIQTNSLTPTEARALQARVSRVVARTGGTQVAINQVAWDGGDTLIPLPGEKRARELGAGARVASVNGCRYLQFCTYGNRDFTGMVDRVSSCTWHISHGFFVAYVNHQTTGTRARFYDYYGRSLAVSQPAFYRDSRFGNDLGHQTHYIKPC